MHLHHVPNKGWKTSLRGASFWWWLCCFSLFFSFSPSVHALPVGDCSLEGSLGGRTDIVFCEPWEDANWWQDGYLKDPRKVNPVPATEEHVTRTEVVSEGCLSGHCLRVDMPVGVTGSLSLHWPLEDAGLSPEQLYLRYYIKLGSAFDPNSCDENGNLWSNGGKFPGLADVRTNSDPSGQCGNGGEPGDGINCWSARADYRNCYSGDGQACATKPNATTRFGSYLYFYNQEDSTGSRGTWDEDDWGQSRGDGGTCGTVPNNVACGQGDGGVFLNGQWYLVEMFIKMNTPGSADGVIEGWVDDVLSYRKTNMLFRLPEHDNLHLRTVWLNVFKGGTKGNCIGSEIYLDQLVVASDGKVGPWSDQGASSPPIPAAPINLNLTLP